MSTPHPHSVADLSLAPVLIELEHALSWLRASKDLEFELALQLNDDGSRYRDSALRADRIVQCATRGIELHHWSVRPTLDLYGLAVQHGEYTVSVMLGRRLTDYVMGGTDTERA